MRDRDSTTIFEALLQRCGLPTVVRRPSMARAVSRAGLSPEALTPATLGQALESVMSTLRVYHSEQDALAHLASIRALTEPKET